MQSYSAEVFDLITNGTAHLYICGDVSMASEVTNNVQQILKSEGRLSDAQAASYIAQMWVSMAYYPNQHKDIK